MRTHTQSYANVFAVNEAVILGVGGWLCEYWGGIGEIRRALPTVCRRISVAYVKLGDKYFVMV